MRGKKWIKKREADFQRSFEEWFSHPHNEEAMESVLNDLVKDPFKKQWVRDCLKDCFRVGFWWAYEADNSEPRDNADWWKE